MIKSSINIKYDLNNIELIKNYYPTSSHAQIIKNLLNSFCKKEKINSFIAYGPYGAGKSYISTLLTSLISGNLSKSNLKILKKKLEEVDVTVKESINLINEKNLKVLPIIINGLEGNFIQTLINNFNRTFKKNKIDIVIPGISNDILNTISRWEIDYPVTYMDFLFSLEEYNYSKKTFLNLIENSDSEVIEIFYTIYSKLTAGSKYHPDYNIPIDEMLYNICKQLEPMGIHVFIVWDEFGRVLQNLNLNDISQFMQIIQNLAELANNGVRNLTTFFISHKPFGYYFSFATKELRDEFAKVEKRFHVMEIRSDYITFLSITSEYLSHEYIERDYTSDKLSLDLIRKFNVFSNELNDTELFNYLGEKTYPLHPISLFVLPKLSSIFGQNERTLFSFLSDENTNGLKNFILYSKGYYYVDRLVDYFFSSIDKSYVNDNYIYNLYKKNIDRIPVMIKKNFINCQRIYKFIMLWKLINGNYIMPLKEQLIAFSLGLQEDDVEKSLNDLRNKKLVRFNVLHNEWEIHEGSSLDIEKEIKKIILTQKYSDDDLLATLNDYNPFRYIFSETYNATNQITRFANIIFGINDYKFDEFSDFKIKLFFSDNSITKDTENYFILKYDFMDVKSYLIELRSLDYIDGSEYYKREYQGISSDIDYMRKTVLNKIHHFYKEIFNSKKNIFNEEVKLQSSLELSKYLSDKFDKLYYDYPIILNDQINMFKISSVQYNSLLKVIDAILNFDEKLLHSNFQGSSPADLIYQTILNNLESINENKAKINNIKQFLKDYLTNNSSGDLKKLLFILCEKPYGLRPYVSVVLTIYFIRNEWKDMLLFNNGNYIPNIKTDDLIQSIFSPEGEISYAFSYFDNVNRDYLIALENIFFVENSLIENKTLSVKVCSHMHSWYLNLPIITQQSIDMTISDIAFLKTIKSSHTNPKTAIENLIASFSLDEIKQFKNSIESHFERFIFNFKKRIMSKVGTDNLVEWALNFDKKIRKTNNLIKGLCDNKEIFDIYKSKTDNLEITKWTSSSFEMLMNLILEDASKTNENVDVDTIVLNGKEKYIQKIDLSIKASTTYENVVNIIDATSKYLTKKEVEKIVLVLVDKYID